jgi:penicillin-binding protein 1C
VTTQQALWLRACVRAYSVAVAAFRTRVFKGALALVAMSWVAFEFALACTAPPDIAHRVASSRALYDRDGGLLRLSLSSDERYRLPVRLDEVAPALIDAVLLHEDQSFFTHDGVDWTALVRATWRTYVTGNRRQGGSTITMQLARMRYGIDSRGVAGKLAQIWKARVIEHHHDKRAILESYFALLPYGGNIEGVEAASLLYFDKRAAHLSEREAYALAVLPQSPERRSPSTEHGRANLISAADRLRARADLSPIGSLDFGGTSRARPDIAPHFADATLAKQPSHARAEAHVTTTIDSAKQRLVTATLARYVERRRVDGIENASALLVDTRDLSVVAEVGSAAYFDLDIEGQVNGTRAKRSPGSTLKPFIYALALDDGLIHPASVLVDLPRRFEGFNPENADLDFKGPMSATEALATSRNVPAVELLSTLGLERLRTLLEVGGVQGLRHVDHYGLALALGGAEVTMYELAALYAALARGGVASPLRTSLDAESPKDGVRLVSEEAALLTLRMLASHRRPDQTFDDQQTRARMKIAWKTGTSHGFRDAWTVGVFGHYVLAVWIGRFDGEGRPSFLGAKAAAPLFFELTDALKDDAGSFEPLVPPERVVVVDVCSHSGQIPGAHCPHTKKTSFIAGRSPIATCDVHRRIAVRRESGLRVCPGDEGEPGVLHVVVEEWPSDLAANFERAGLPRRGPPAFEDGCVAVDESVVGLAPRIVAPTDGARIHITISGRQSEPVVLRAVTGTDTRHHDWFAGTRFIGRSPRDGTLEWQPEPGETALKVVDDRGRADTIQVSVVARL